MMYTAPLIKCGLKRNVSRLKGGRWLIALFPAFWCGKSPVQTTSSRSAGKSGMKTVEVEVEKIRVVRRDIARQFDFDTAKLGDGYRRQEASLKAVSRTKPGSGLTTARVKETPES